MSEERPLAARQGGFAERLTVLLVVGISLIVVLGVIGVKYASPLSETSTPGPSSSQALTFYSAVGVTNATAASFSGGPWVLISAQGVYATKPATLQPLTGPAGLNFSIGSIASCQALRGPTVWNTSGIPVFEGPFNTGESPFWSMIYLNASLYLLQVQWDNGSVFEVPPLSPASPCGYFAEQILMVSELLPLSDSSIAWFPYDSSLAGQRAWQISGSSFAANHSGFAEVYGLGQDVFNIMPSDVGWNVLYDSCPISGGSTWFRNYTYVDIRGPPGTLYVIINGRYTCWPFNWSVSFGPVIQSPVSGGVWVDAPVNLSTDWGLVTWMAALQLNSSGNHPVDVAKVSCTPSNLSEVACRPAGSGWIAALTSVSGGWLDVYASNGTGAGWLIPNVSIYTGDSLEVYVPSSVDPSGSQLILSQTQSNIGIGSVSVSL